MKIHAAPGSADALTVISDSPQETMQIGEGLGQLLLPGDVVCLEGDLGAGKTYLTKGIGRGLGVRQPITSPTFVLINEYVVAPPIHKLYHIDLYRVNSVAESCSLGLEDYLYRDGICVIEWAERAREILPEERLWIVARYLDENRRELALESNGAHYQRLVQRLRQALSQH